MTLLPCCLHRDRCRFFLSRASIGVDTLRETLCYRLRVELCFRPYVLVLISGKEDPDAQVSPAIDAVLRVFKRVNGLSPSEGESMSLEAAGAAFCSIRLLVASSQAIHLIGKQGSTIKSIQEISSASVRVLSEVGPISVVSVVLLVEEWFKGLHVEHCKAVGLGLGDMESGEKDGENEVPSYATQDERIVEIHGEALKVLKALEAVLGQLRKFLVDHSVVPIFEKTYNATISQDRAVESWPDKTQSLPHPTSASAAATPLQTGSGSDFSLSVKRGNLFFDRESQLDSDITYSKVSLYGQDPGLGGLRSTGLGRTAAPIITQVRLNVV
ncbi:unnamed protein product [Ilex paraguariensis]|uniref:K Homology domain-containing protein n=1 Tax=Ilex paraguariensis TaxID=185542 RepID=A0ABC8V3V6_9AQUA